MLPSVVFQEELKPFFEGRAGHFSYGVFGHFWGLAPAIIIGHGATIERLAKLLRGSTHRTNHGEFLWRSDWNESAVLEQIALDTLWCLRRKDGGTCYLIIDATQTLKRAEKMAARQR